MKKMNLKSPHLNGIWVVYSLHIPLHLPVPNTSFSKRSLALKYVIIMKYFFYMPVDHSVTDEERPAAQQYQYFHSDWIEYIKPGVQLYLQLKLYRNSNKHALLLYVCKQNE